MIKVKNLYNAIEVKNKSGKLIKRVQIENRLLDNYLDYMIWLILPKSIGNVLFSKFDSTSFESYDAFFGHMPISTAYLSKATQIIEDTDTTMTYVATSELINISAGQEGHILTEDITTKSKIFTYRLGDIIPLTDGELNPLLVDGDLIYGLGYGLSNWGAFFTDYLLTFVDVSSANIIYDAYNVFDIVRSDLYETNEVLLEGDKMYHLPGYHYSGRLYSITPCYGENGTIPGKEYLAEGLTYTYVSTGKVQISGFDNFHIENNLLYPDTAYPDTVYPVQGGEKIKSFKFKYKCMYRADFWHSEVYGLEEYLYTTTYININDLDVSYEGTSVKINLIIERG